MTWPEENWSPTRDYKAPPRPSFCQTFTRIRAVRHRISTRIKMEQNSSQGWFRYQTRCLFGVEPLCLPFTLLKPEPFLVIHMERKHLDRALYPPSQAQAFDIFKRANGLWMDVPDQARLLERF